MKRKLHGGNGRRVAFRSGTDPTGVSPDLQTGRYLGNQNKKRSRHSGAGMEINADVISQGIVLVSILAGFAFFIAADIALRDRTTKPMEHVALFFFATGLVLVFTASIGVIYYANAANKPIQRQYGMVFLLFLVLSICAFIASLHQLLREKMSSATYGALLILMIATLFLIAVAVFATLIT